MRNDSTHELRMKLADYLRPAPNYGFYICPLCGSGTGPKKTGAMKLTDDGLHVKCFACDFYGDIFDVVGKQYGLNAGEAYKKTAEWAGQLHPAVVRTEKTRTTALRAAPDAAIANSRRFDGYVAEAARVLEEHPAAMAYLKGRGLTEETIEHWRLGYDAAAGQIVVPYGDTGYFIRRGVGEGRVFYKPPAAQAGPEPLFNAKALGTESCVFVVESQLCAVSVGQVGGAAVALGGTGIRRLLERLNRHKTDAVLVLSLDNDARGAETRDALAEALERLGIAHVAENIAGAYKDPNEALQREPEQFAQRVAEAQTRALEHRDAVADEERRAYLATSAASHVGAFVGGIAASVDTPAVPTGFEGLDAALDGGLYEGLYVVGAISSLGKTTFILQMADQIAKQGRDVLFFSLEMARSELMAKSISRLTWELCGGESANAKTTRGITDGKRYAGYSQKERTIIQQAVAAYEAFAGRLYICEGAFDTGADKIAKTLARHVKLTGRVPVVMIDYLQILAPAEPRATDKQNTDRAVFELKRLSREYKTPVVAISSLNRENYTAKMSLAAFKESGAIEYSSDVLLGLEFALPQGAEKLTPDLLDEAKRQNPRRIELKVLKNRTGESGAVVDFVYWAQWNGFGVWVHKGKTVRR